MPVNTELTDSMIKRLAKIPDNFKEPGDTEDPTRLCKSWKGALDEDKTELEHLVTDPSLGAKLSAGKIKEEYPKFRIYTSTALQNAIGNYKRKAREAIEKRNEMDRNGGGGEGLKAKNSASKTTTKNDDSASRKSSKSKSTKKSAKKKSPPNVPPGYFHSTATMYSKGNVTLRTTKTTASNANISFAGRTINGNSGGTGQDTTPVLSTIVAKAIGGSLGMSQLDHWQDKSLNKRASANLMLSSGCVLNEANMIVRPSSQPGNGHILVITLEISHKFTNPDLKLRYLLERVGEAYGINPEEEPEKCMQILQTGGRYTAAMANLQALLGHRNTNTFLLDYRMTAPFEIDECLVTKAEDPVFYGHHVDDSDGEIHIHFELKEKASAAGKPFTPVIINGQVNYQASGFNTKNKQSMFGGLGGMGSIPENITFRSPNGKSRASRMDDDDSTIATEDHHRAPPGTKTNGLDDDEDDDESSWDSNLMDVESNNSEVERLRKQVEELSNIVSGLYQSKSKDSGDSGQNSKSTATGSPKKKKTNEGGASGTSVAGSKASRRSNATRGVDDREDKRKTRSTDPKKKDE